MKCKVDQGSAGKDSFERIRPEMVATEYQNDHGKSHLFCFIYYLKCRIQRIEQRNKEMNRGVELITVNKLPLMIRVMAIICFL